MKAPDILAESYFAAGGTCEQVAAHQLDALLAQTPPGEGVFIAPDGELWRLEPRRDPRRYRLVPIEEATDE